MGPSWQLICNKKNTAKGREDRLYKDCRFHLEHPLESLVPTVASCPVMRPSWGQRSQLPPQAAPWRSPGNAAGPASIRWHAPGNKHSPRGAVRDRASPTVQPSPQQRLNRNHPAKLVPAPRCTKAEIINMCCFGTLNLG